MIFSCGNILSYADKKATGVQKEEMFYKADRLREVFQNVNLISLPVNRLSFILWFV